MSTIEYGRDESEQTNEPDRERYHTVVVPAVSHEPSYEKESNITCCVGDYVVYEGQETLSTQHLIIVK